jgi:hypothetical protein
VGVLLLNALSKEKTVALKVMLRFTNGGLGQNRTADTRIFNANPKLKSTVFSTCCNLRKFWCAIFVHLSDAAKVRTVLKSILTIPVISLPTDLQNTMCFVAKPLITTRSTGFTQRRHCNLTQAKTLRRCS